MYAIDRQSPAGLVKFQQGRGSDCTGKAYGELNGFGRGPEGTFRP